MDITTPTVAGPGRATQCHRETSRIAESALPSPERQTVLMSISANCDVVRVANCRMCQIVSVLLMPR
jgi:hypothetical protein